MVGVLSSIFFFLGLNSIAKIMPMKPKKAIIGPIVTRLTENMSGLYLVAPLGSPTIRAKPTIVMIKNTTISMLFNFGRLYFIIKGIDWLIVLLDIVQVVRSSTNVLVYGEARRREGGEQSKEEDRQDHNSDILHVKRKKAYLHILVAVPDH